ncbi:hypothetical protein [Spirillospora sp. CA-128828]|uniref:hypothetical protein n=1 Tax=Spirillospora sp. CA-128828 TaxID=3240033 RepID=UPI003D91D501
MTYVTDLLVFLLGTTRPRRPEWSCFACPPMGRDEPTVESAQWTVLKHRAMATRVLQTVVHAKLASQEMRAAAMAGADTG